ncbi:hypothetical protein PoB_006702800 [Plakobranchus ocellatus]|uniref:Uncharacterized protein n=1 Tax=Plakobranchus ocellatus TaxID=259542 RepID=A0AAV4D8Z5_9GAST|nr:hypothetical protein PoB_006702800 [Plakobranchus ocellatus]
MASEVLLTMPCHIVSSALSRKTEKRPPHALDVERPCARNTMIDATSASKCHEVLVRAAEVWPLLDCCGLMKSSTNQNEVYLYCTHMVNSLHTWLTHLGFCSCCKSYFPAILPSSKATTSRTASLTSRGQTTRPLPPVVARHTLYINSPSSRSYIHHQL